MQQRNVLLLLLLILCLSGCQDEDSPRLPLGPESWLPLQVGKVPLEVQIVLTQEEQRKGLMYRESLPEEAGMIFTYQSPRRLSFWMANTRIPLSIGYFDAQGVLREIHHLVPFDTRPTASHSETIQYALEVNKGWFARHGLYPGEQLDLQLLAEGLRQRGADPRRFGLE